MPVNIPTDFLFGVGSYDSSEVSSWVQSQQQTTITSGNPGKSGPGLGNVTQPGQGNGLRSGNVTQPGPGNGPRAGNITRQGQGSGQGQNAFGQGPGNTGNITQMGQERRMPVDMIIAQLGQKGYDITGAATAIQSGDRQAQKAWLDNFKTNNPGVAEARETSWTGNNQGQNGGSGSSNTSEPSRGPAKGSGKSIIDVLKDWFSSL